MHVLLFAGLAWVGGRIWPGRFSRWFLWLALALMAAVLEWVQPLAGRSTELADWLYGAGGAACLCSGRRPLRMGSRLRWAALCALACFPPVWEAAMWRLEMRAFPVLAQPGAGWARRGWTLNACTLSVSPESRFRVAGVNEGKGGRPPAYPGLFRIPVRPDWSRQTALRTAIFWPRPEPGVFAVRVDDRAGNPPYAERFQKEFAVTQGWNAVEIRAAELRRTSGGRPLDLESIRLWGVFLVSPVPLDYFLLDPVRLVPEENGP